MGGNHLFAVLDPEGVPLEDGPSPATDAAIRNPIGLSIVANTTRAHDLARFFMDQEQFKIYG